MKIKAVIFDIDGTLYQSEKYVEHLIDGICRTLSEFLSITYEDAEKLFHSLRSKIGSISLGLKEIGIERAEFYESLVRKLNPKEFIPPKPEIVEMIKELKKSGFKVGCHTNSSRKLAEMVLEALGVDLRLLDILVTCDDAEPKPMPDGYLKIMNDLKLRAGEVLYVGDRWRVEVEPAKKLGMKTALVTSKPEGKPDVTVRDVLEIPEKVKSFGDP